MALSNQPVFVQTPKTGAVQILNADGTASKTVFAAGTDGAKVTGINITSSDTSDQIVQLRLTRSATHYLLGAATITALAGFDGTVESVNMMEHIQGAPVDNDGQVYLFLESGDTLTTVLQTGAVTSGKAISVVAVSGNF